MSFKQKLEPLLGESPESSTSSSALDFASSPAKEFLALPLRPATPYISSHHSTSTLSLSHGPRARSRSPFPGGPSGLSLWIRFKNALYNNRGIMFMLLSQFFGSLMSLTTRILETSFPEQRFHALQILFVRQSFTSALVYVWAWRMKIEDAPFGPRGVRGLLVVRGVCGFFGVFGLYYSLSYLDLSDATVITFLAPMVTIFACSLIPSLREPLTRTNFIASFISLSGVVLIARPTILFHFGRSGDDGYDEVVPPGNIRRAILPSEDEKLSVTPRQRLIAVLVALLGVLGIGSAFTIIRWIGKRAHPLINVGYFSTWCVIVSLAALLTIPSIGGIIWPVAAAQWGLLIGIGVSGFALQFFLTAGLQIEKAGRATNMVYSQILFALFWEYLVWGTVPNVLSIAGGTLIMGSVVWVGVDKQAGEAKVRAEDVEVAVPLVSREGRRYSVDSDGDVSSGRTSWCDWGDEDEGEQIEEQLKEL